MNPDRGFVGRPKTDAQIFHAVKNYFESIGFTLGDLNFVSYKPLNSNPPRTIRLDIPLNIFNQDSEYQASIRTRAQIANLKRFFQGAANYNFISDLIDIRTVLLVKVYEYFEWLLHHHDFKAFESVSDLLSNIGIIDENGEPNFEIIVQKLQEMEIISTSTTDLIDLFQHKSIRSDFAKFIEDSINNKYMPLMLNLTIQEISPDQGQVRFSQAHSLSNSSLIVSGPAALNTPELWKEGLFPTFNLKDSYKFEASRHVVRTDRNESITVRGIEVINLPITRLIAHIMELHCKKPNRAGIIGLGAFVNSLDLSIDSEEIWSQLQTLEVLPLQFAVGIPQNTSEFARALLVDLDEIFKIFSRIRQFNRLIFPAHREDINKVFQMYGDGLLRLMTSLNLQSEDADIQEALLQQIHNIKNLFYF